LNGECLHGELLQAGKYELVLKGEDGELIVFKHAVAYIIPVKGASTNPA